MHILEKAYNLEDICIPTSESSFDDLLNKEWLLTNKRGGYASSTIACCNTQRYHGLLIGSLSPPSKRVMALSNCLETIRVGEKEFYLSSYEFDVKFAPEAHRPLQFRQNVGVHFDYKLGEIELTKSLYLLGDSDTAVVVYNFNRVAAPFEFRLQPFIGLRDYHSLQKSNALIYSGSFSDGVLIRNDVPESCGLFLRCPDMDFEADEQWWYNMLYRGDRERGYDFMEDLWTPGVFKRIFGSPQEVVFWVSLRAGDTENDGRELISLLNSDIESALGDLGKHQEQVIGKVKFSDGGKERIFKRLCLAADQFVVRRGDKDKEGWTILAGFPWFSEWGRDAFISLSGLLLLTGRYEAARAVLMSFAQTAEGGMIPNYFDEHSGKAEFNSIDASLWFIYAAFAYLEASGDNEMFSRHLLPVICWIVDCYNQGTRFGICTDDDGLVKGGDENTQLTWMDVKSDGRSFTPRYGKAVEVNALWFNCLCYLANYYERRNAQVAKSYKSMADRCSDSFKRLFWNELTGYLNDCILLDGMIDASLRPNQIFAVSLLFSPLEDYQAKSVVDVVESKLLTPYGLRTLDIFDSRYKGTYSGSLHQRDEAYHQGTVWPYLIGPFVEAYLKVNDYDQDSRQKAAGFVEPLLEHMMKAGCIGQISEIFDGDKPHRPRGCFAQAWSVAEIIRAYLLVNS